MNKVLLAIDSINEWMGKIVAWLFIPLVFVITYEVVLRYVFNDPTLWAWDVNVQLLAALVVAGGGCALLHKDHIVIDILVGRLQPRKRALCEAITGILLIASVGLLLWRISLGAWHSVVTAENFTSIFAPPIYPLKAFMVVGIGAMLLQGVADWVRSILILTKRDGNEH